MLKDVDVVTLENGDKYWEQTFDTFKVQTYIPKRLRLDTIINFGFIAPYLCVFAENELTMEEAISYAKETEMANYIAMFCGSINFFTPIGKDWDQCDLSFYQDIVAESRISQYYRDGYAIMWDRFNKRWGDKYIRGCIPKICVIGKGKAADYIARTLLNHVEGLGIFGPGDITPASCVLEKVSCLPETIASDIPVLSINNNDSINNRLIDSLEHFEKATMLKEYHFWQFIHPFRRMVKTLEIVPLPDSLGMVDIDRDVIIKTAADNRGDDKDTSEHKIGFIAMLNKKTFKAKTKVPLLLCFHGGGDSAYYMATISGWYRIAAENNFLLVCVEDHLNSTATEMMDLIKHLKTIFNIDSERIYATGFSMGGCKSWDMMQEYPKVFAAAAPMDATFEVGCNSYGNPVPGYNTTETLPIFYAGGEITPLPELPFQAQKCIDRMAYVFKANNVIAPYSVILEGKEYWENKIWGVNGDTTLQLFDPDRNGTLTLQFFRSMGNKCYSVFASIDNQGHEVRKHTCENAWKFMSSFRRLSDGTIVGGDYKDIVALYQ